MTILVRITAVSYLNTLPFIYGIERRVAQISCSLRDAKQGKVLPVVVDVALSLQVPALCAAEAIQGCTDVALVPVAAIPLIPCFDIAAAFSTAHTTSCSQPISTLNAYSAGGDSSDFKPHIITDYCIGAEGAVDTVVLLSDTPIQDVKTVYLDSHSRTSVELVQVLSREHWGITPRWVDFSVSLSDKGNALAPGEAMLAIGDKVFTMTTQHHYSYRYDLAAEWSAFTGGMPFVFAAWVACTPAGAEFAPRLNEMLAHGVEHIAESITETVNRSQDFDFDSAYHYLTERVKYNLDDPKRAAMRLFWKKTITPG